MDSWDRISADSAQFVPRLCPMQSDHTWNNNCMVVICHKFFSLLLTLTLLLTKNTCLKWGGSQLGWQATQNFPHAASFRLKTGEGFIGRLLNSHLAVLLKMEAMKQGGSFSFHLFRANPATETFFFFKLEKNTMIDCQTGNFGFSLKFSLTVNVFLVNHTFS